MRRNRTAASLGLIAIGLAVSISSAGAAEAPAPIAEPPAAPSPPSPEDVSLQGFASQNPLCREWDDGCSVCLRDEKDAAHCSTPGIACQPEPIRCRRGTAK
ncbi:MAG: hypothetical protein ACLQE9_17010 [Roseiarcus sp.]